MSLDFTGPGVDPNELADLIARAQQTSPQNTPATPGDGSSGPPSSLFGGPTPQSAQQSLESPGVNSYLPPQPGAVKGMLSNYLGKMGSNLEGTPAPTPELQAPQAPAPPHGMGKVGAFLSHWIGMPTQSERTFGQQLAASRQAVDVQNANVNQDYKNMQAEALRQSTQMVNTPQEIQDMGFPAQVPQSMLPGLTRIIQSRQQNLAGLDLKYRQNGQAVVRDESGAAVMNPDGTPQVRNLSLAELPIPTQLRAQMAAMQQELNQSKLNAARLDPNTPEGQAALIKLQNDSVRARAIMSMAGARVGMTQVAQERYMADYFGLGPDGMPLPGTPTDESGTPLGWKSPMRPTSAVVTRGQVAASVLPHLSDLDTQIDRLAAQGKLGPVAGRLGDVMTGKVGIKDPEFQKFLTDSGMASSAVLMAHFGARGGQQMYDHFVAMLNAAGGDPANIHAAIDSFRGYMQGYKEAGMGGYAPPSNKKGGNVPTVGQTKKFPNGKIGKWDGKGWVQQ